MLRACEAIHPFGLGPAAVIVAAEGIEGRTEGLVVHADNNNSKSFVAGWRRRRKVRRFGLIGAAVERRRVASAVMAVRCDNSCRAATTNTDLSVGDRGSLVGEKSWVSWSARVLRASCVARRQRRRAPGVSERSAATVGRAGSGSATKFLTRKSIGCGGGVARRRSSYSDSEWGAARTQRRASTVIGVVGASE